MRRFYKDQSGLCLLIIFMLAALGSGCGHLRSREDKFEQVRVDQLTDNAIDASVFERSRVYFNPRRETRLDGKASFYTQVEFYSTSEFGVVPGESLVVVADGKRYGLTPTNTMVAVKTRRGFTSLNYEVNPQMLVDLANARQAQLRLRGNPNAIEKTFDRGNKQDLKAFLVKYEIAEFKNPPPEEKKSRKSSTRQAASQPPMDQPAPAKQEAEEPVSKLEPNPQP